MFLIIIYIVLFLMSVLLFYVNNRLFFKYKRYLVRIHLISFVLLLINVVLVIGFESSFKTFWFNRLALLCFLISGAFIFAIGQGHSKLRDKFYFGFFFFYPIFTALTMMMDRIFFVLVASPFLWMSITPEIYYHDSNYDIRRVRGIMAPRILELVKNGVFLETRVGMYHGEDIENKAYQNLKIITQNSDSISVSVDIAGVTKKITFLK